MMTPVRATQGRARRGQIAVGFLVLMTFAILLSRMTLNLGQMAQLRVETSNAVDAATLAAASWLASGENEAAYISQRMWDAIYMVQALYLVPFCADQVGDPPEHQAYAETLWTALYDRPVGMASLPIVGGERYGVNRYFEKAANAAMVAALMVGHREFLTSALNNMVMRYATSATLNCDPLLDDCGGAIVMQGSLPQKIRDAQDGWYLTQIRLSQTLPWNNTKLAPTPGYVRHIPTYELFDFPDDPPTLRMRRVRAWYRQYRPEVINVGSQFDCSFDGVGITSTGGPYPDLAGANLQSDLPPAQHNPLKVYANGRKGWDIDLIDAIPGIGAGARKVNLGVCSRVCGMRLRRTPSVAIQPSSIRGGNGTVGGRVHHKVEHGPDTAKFTGISLWKRRFGTIVSEATASFSAAGVDPPDPRASAELTSVK